MYHHEYQKFEKEIEETFDKLEKETLEANESYLTNEYINKPYNEREAYIAIKNDEDCKELAMIQDYIVRFLHLFNWNQTPLPFCSFRYDTDFVTEYYLDIRNSLKINEKIELERIEIHFSKDFNIRPIFKFCSKNMFISSDDIETVHFAFCRLLAKNP